MIHSPGMPKAHALLEDPLQSGNRLTSQSTWHPNSNYRYSFKLGMEGWDVWVIQVALNGRGASLVEDGKFGPLTSTAVKQEQAKLRITIDGIIGPQTQNALCAAECARVQMMMTPAGLLKGICFGESGGIIPATSTRYANGTIDYFSFQNNMLNPTDAQLREAANVGTQANAVCRELKAAHDIFQNQAGAKTQKLAWELATLSYNWPAAASQIAQGHESTWEYSSEGHKYKLADPAPWIEQIGVQGVSTGAQWCARYIQTKTVYVDTWIV